MLIDLHAHSSASDGTESPAELMQAARAAGLDVVALTDHDTTSGWSEAAEAVPAGMTLVRGTEISCAVGGVSLHLLAYLFDPEHAELRAELDLAFDDRIPRAQAIVARLGEAGHPITWQHVLDQLEPGATVGRPHIADALVAVGVVPDRSTAFADLLHNGSRFFVDHYAVEPVRAVQLVRAAGGVAVFAHPAASHRGRTVDESVIHDLADAGLAGLEVDHRDNPPEARERLRGIAAERGLLVTGSSDYHGSGKPNRLGENSTDPEVFAALVAQATGTDVVAA
ncbi:MAG: 3,5-nucleoside bisphosphate phosphatase [Actinomycetota bacterium]|nr:3,5-nucleoside bisphosphate phosphatase [Actinomycetota bacterium]MDQ1669574.1 3,5-nucleoside bisphosphate phosphatase [Actinomycetota bacterium]